MIAIRRIAVALAVVVLAVACSKEKPRTPDAAERQIGGPAQPAPADVALWVSTASPAHALTGLRDYVEAVQPGGGAMLSEQQLRSGLAGAAGMRALDGIDLDAPFHLVVVDGEKVQGVVVVGRIQKRNALDPALGKAHLEVAVAKSGDRWAMVGEKAAVELVAPWVASTLLAEAAPAPVTVTVQVATVAARHQADIDAFRTQFLASMPRQSGASAANMEKLMGWYMDALATIMTDSERAVITLEAEASTASFSFALVPRAGSRLAAFTGAQKPSDFALLARLPAGAAPVLMAGHMEMGPFREAWMALMVESMGLSGMGDGYAAAMTEILRLASGDFAARFAFGEQGMAYEQIFPLTDVDAARKAARAWLTTVANGRTMDSMGVHMTITGQADAGEHDGVALSAYEMQVDLASLPPEQAAPLTKIYGGGGIRSYLAFTDGFGLVALGGKDAGKIGGLIDALRGKAVAWSPSPELAAFLEQARQRHDSFVMTLDLGGIMSAVVPGMAAAPPAADGGLRFTLGFDGGQLRLRFELASASVRALKPAPTSR